MLKLSKLGKDNISLVGMMGSGKSIIGQNLSKKYKIDFYDTDKEIEKETGTKIYDIFEKYGEKYFRDIEEKVCIKILQNKNCIVSLGGGSITNSKIRKIIKNKSFSIYLKVDLDIFVSRLKNSYKRPLLKQNDKNKKINELYKNRMQFYNDCDLIVENNANRKITLDNIVSLLKI